MVSYAELDDLQEFNFDGGPLAMARASADEAIVEKPKDIVIKPKVKDDNLSIQDVITMFMGDDDTECNMLLMFFVIGVVLLAISDSLRH